MEGALADEHAPFITHEEATQKSFQDDPAFAAEYLNAGLRALGLRIAVVPLGHR